MQGPLESAELLGSYDAYYYSVGTGARRRLPVLRLTFDDPVTRLMYVDPHTGSIARAYDTHAMVMRWVVFGLHTLDFPFLIRNRPAWDITIITLSVVGLVPSVSGVVMLNKNNHPLFIAINREPLFGNSALSNGGLGNSMPGRAFFVGFEWRT